MDMRLRVLESLDELELHFLNNSALLHVLETAVVTDNYNSSRFRSFNERSCQCLLKLNQCVTPSCKGTRQLCFIS